MMQRSPDFTKVLTRVNTVAILLLVLIIGAISSSHWESEPASAASAETYHLTMTGAIGTFVRYPKTGTIVVCNGAKRYTLCCETTKYTLCNSNEKLVCELHRESPTMFEYYASIKIEDTSLVGARCKLWCNK